MPVDQWQHTSVGRGEEEVEVVLDLDSFGEEQRLLLMAAAAHGLRPGIDLRANCAKVVGQALVWSGGVDDSVLAAWREMNEHPLIDRFYDVLIAMIRHDPPSEALFEGIGNFGAPGRPAAAPHFTACRLTAIGERIADGLLARHAEYRVDTSGPSPSSQ